MKNQANFDKLFFARCDVQLRFIYLNCMRLIHYFYIVSDDLLKVGRIEISVKQALPFIVKCVIPEMKSQQQII